MILTLTLPYLSAKKLDCGWWCEAVVAAKKYECGYNTLTPKWASPLTERHALTSPRMAELAKSQTYGSVRQSDCTSFQESDKEKVAGQRKVLIRTWDTGAERKGSVSWGMITIFSSRRECPTHTRMHTTHSLSFSVCSPCHLHFLLTRACFQSNISDSWQQAVREDWSLIWCTLWILLHFTRKLRQLQKWKSV